MTDNLNVVCTDLVNVPNTIEATSQDSPSSKSSISSPSIYTYIQNPDALVTDLDVNLPLSNVNVGSDSPSDRDLVIEAARQLMQNARDDKNTLISGLDLGCDGFTDLSIIKNYNLSNSKESTELFTDWFSTIMGGGHGDACLRVVHTLLMHGNNNFREDTQNLMRCVHLLSDGSRPVSGCRSIINLLVYSCKITRDVPDDPMYIGHDILKIYQNVISDSIIVATSQSLPTWQQAIVDMFSTLNGQASEVIALLNNGMYLGAGTVVVATLGYSAVSIYGGGNLRNVAPISSDITIHMPSDSQQITQFIYDTTNALGAAMAEFGRIASEMWNNMFR